MDGSDPRRVAQTNDSSIVSKRSAERAGYFDEDQFLRQFCAKAVRRAPLINLGYAIRTTLLDEAVTAYILDAVGTLSKGAELFIVNLGAGFDPSFFRVEAKWRTLLHERGLRLCWVDVDFPLIVSTKLSVIDSQLRNVFTRQPTAETWVSNDDGSLAYALVGCDMCDAALLMSRLEPLVPPRAGSILFTSEVALVYMISSSSDTLLDAIANTYPDSTYAFLEQLVPFDEPGAAFASTMMHHFERSVRTPLWGTLSYPTLEAQRRRLAQRWSDVSVSTMLEAWRGLAGRKPETAKRLFSAEPFDEWEALDLFMSHYAVGFAGSKAGILRSGFRAKISSDMGHAVDRNEPLTIQGHAVTLETTVGRRGHTSTLLLDGTILIFGGHGSDPARESQGKGTALQARLSHPVLLSLADGSLSVKALPPTSTSPDPRVYHTATLVGTFESPIIAIFGGRAGPCAPYGDLHLFDCRKHEWRRPVVDSPAPCARFRHAAVAVTDTMGARQLMIQGGIDSEGRTLSDAWIYDVALNRWSKSTEISATLGARHSHAMCRLAKSIYVCGGLHSPGTFASDVTLSASCPFSTRVVLCDLQRYGHRILPWSDGSVLVCGGVGKSGVLSSSDQVIIWSPDRGEISGRLKLDFAKTRCLVDHDVCLVRDDVVQLTGGGLTTFSFGSRLEDKVVYFGAVEASLPRSTSGSLSNGFHTPSILPSEPAPVPGSLLPAEPALVPRVSPTAEKWRSLLQDARPTVLAGLSIGACTDLWTPAHLRARCGHHRVSVHVSDRSPNLQWHDRNFRYEATNFSEAVSRTLEAPVDANETVYLRSLSRSRKQAARLEADFPEIADDFRLPEEIWKEVEERVFSSPLRLSGPDTRMWPHYDTASNVLVQVRGRKRVLLWSPLDVDKLYVKGSSSVIPDVLNVDLQTFPLFAQARPLEAVLEPGDILYIPALWLHATTCLSAEGGVAVNVFFRQHADEIYARGDVWANVDLTPFSTAEKEVDRAVAALRQSGLSPLEQGFYLKKLGLALLAQAGDGHAM